MGLFNRLRSRAANERAQTIRANHYPGDEPLEVVGESHHQEALWSIVGGRRSTPVQHNTVALLQPEPDNRYDPNAIRVLVDGRPVGHLAREDAAAYSTGLRHLMQSSSTGIVALDATIAGGGQRGDGLGYPGSLSNTTPRTSASSTVQEDPAPQSRAGGAESTLPRPCGREWPTTRSMTHWARVRLPAAAYLQLLLQVLGDGALSVGEGEALRACAREYRLSADDLQAVHRGLLVAVARQAIEDDVVARGEREELRQVARMLDLPDATVSAALTTPESGDRQRSVKTCHRYPTTGHSESRCASAIASPSPAAKPSAAARSRSAHEPAASS